MPFTAGQAAAIHKPAAMRTETRSSGRCRQAVGLTRGAPGPDPGQARQRPNFRQNNKSHARSEFALVALHLYQTCR